MDAYMRPEKSNSIVLWTHICVQSFLDKRKLFVIINVIIQLASINSFLKFFLISMPFNYVNQVCILKNKIIL